MSQSETLTWLQSNPGWHTVSEVAENMGISKRTARDDMRLLLKWGWLERANKDKIRVMYRAVMG